jgi:hypothetical protein
MATRFIGGMSAEGLPEIAGAVPAAGGVVVEVDTALEPERGDLVACSTADDCPSAPQIARIWRVDAEAGTLEVQPLDTALEAATVARDAKPEDGLTVDGVIVAAYAPRLREGPGRGTLAQGLAPEVAAPSPGRYRGADSVDQNRARSKPIPRRGRGRSI